MRNHRHDMQCRSMQVGDRLYLGNLGGDYISYVTVPAATATS